MPRSLRFRPRFFLSGLLGLLVAAVAVGPFGSVRPTAANPPAIPLRADAPLPAELQYVPPDAAFFLHADAAAIWTHEVTKSFRAADKATFGNLEEGAIKAFGSKIDDLKSVTFYIPKLKTPPDTERLGIVLSFANAYDKKKLGEGVAGLFPKNAKVNVVAASEKVALVLVGLGEEYAKPQPAGAEGPLTGAIKAAASGKHTVVLGITPSNLPDELQKDDLPGQVRAFQPIFKSESIVAALDLNKSLTLKVRVKTKREAAAVDAEKALAAFVKMMTDEIDRELPDIEKEAATDAGLKDLVKVFKAALGAAKGAKFEVEGTEARATATLPLDGLPLASAYAATVTRVHSAAALSRSSNNLKQIALAMHNYHDANNNFPPAAVCDKKGKPQLSWRVLILPYIEQDELYKQFKLDEPWDSDNNKKLIAKMPAVYAMPGKSKPGATETYYRVFVGNGAGFEWLMGGKFTNIADGTSNTFMCVTAAEAVTWTKPDELEFDPDKDMTKLMGLVVNGKAQVAMFDGSVRSLSKLPDRKTLNALITASGGEVVPNDF